MVWAFRFLKDVFLMVRSFLFEQSPVNQILLLLECVCVCEISEFSAYPKVMKRLLGGVNLICLAVSDLSCGMWDLSLRREGSVVVAGRPSCHEPQ